MADDLGVKVNIDLGSTKTFEAKIKQYTPKNKIKVDIDIDQKTLNKLNEYAKAVKQINKAANGEISKTTGASATSPKSLKTIKDYSSQILTIQKSLSKFKINNKDLITRSDGLKKALVDFEQLNDKFLTTTSRGKELQNELNNLRSSFANLDVLATEAKKNVSNENLFASIEKRVRSLNVEVENYLNTNKRVANSSIGKSMANVASGLTLDSTSADIEKARARFYELQLQAKQLGLESETAGQKLRKLFNEHMNTAIAMAGIHALQQAFVQLWQAIQDVDAAMTELKKVTNETEATYERFLSEAATRAKNIGSSLSDVIQSTADFARLGYGLDEATSLADSANIYKNVGD